MGLTNGVMCVVRAARGLDADPLATAGTLMPEPAFRALLDRGLVDAYRLRHNEPARFTWWDYRAGNFHKNFGKRIDHLLVSAPVAARVAWSEIDREARKGTPVPSDHAPPLVDLDEPGVPIDAGWVGAASRIATRGGLQPG